MIKEYNLVPQKRFYMFKGEWEECYLLDQIESIIDFRGRTPKKLGLNWSEYGYLALSALNVKNGYIDFKVNTHYGSQELYDKWMKGKELKKNQVLFTTEAPMGNVAQVPDDRGYILSQRTIAFVTDNKMIIDDFLAVLLRSNNVYKKLISLSSGGTAIGVSQKTLEKLKIAIPSELQEQQKIGEFFKVLDERIANQERKIAKVKALKSAYLTEMFPQEGETVPKRRFKGFEGEWRGAKLKEIANRYDNLRIPITASKRLPGITPYYGANGIQDYVKGHTHDGENVLIAEHGANDLNNYPVHYCDGEIWVNNHAHVLRGKDNILNNLFFSYLLKTISMKPYLVGGGRAKLNSDTMMDINCIVPQIAEQQKIGQFFKNLDDQITTEEKKLEKLKKMKEAYLEEMFI